MSADEDMEYEFEQPDEAGPHFSLQTVVQSTAMASGVWNN
jgi:hypothetical protein